MFGKIPRNLVVGITLILFCGFVIKLYAGGDIGLYIHPRYSLFAAGMAVLGAAVLILGAIWRPKRASSRMRFSPVDFAVMAVLVLAFVLPARALSSGTIQRKSVNTPSYDNSTNPQAAAKPCPEDTAVTIEGWVYLISEYPDCYDGKYVAITGFVLSSADNPLPDDMYYLGRVVISCCVIDARPYALPINQGNFERYPNETWLTILGKLQRKKVNGITQLVVNPERIQPADSPNRPYEYLNTQPITNIKPAQLMQ